MATLGGNLCQRPRCWYYRLEEFDCRKKGGTRVLRPRGREPLPRDLRHRPALLLRPSRRPRARRSWPTARPSTCVVRRARRSLPIEQFFHRPTRRRHAREHARARRDRRRRAAPGASRPATRSVYRKLKEKESFDWPLVETCVALTISGRRRSATRASSSARSPRRRYRVEGGRGGARGGRARRPELAQQGGRGGRRRREAAVPERLQGAAWRGSSSSGRCDRSSRGLTLA